MALSWHVDDARAQVDMRHVTELVVDETSRAKRHQYVSLFLEPVPPVPSERKRAARRGDAEEARVLFVTAGRSHGAVHEFVTDLAAHGGAAPRVREVCMDLSPAYQPYQRGAAEALPNAAVTFDRFHVMKLVNNAALDDARRREQPHRPELKRSRYAWLTNPVNASAAQRTTLDRLRTLNLVTAKAYQMRLNMRLNVQAVWDCGTAAAAETALRRWCTWVARVAKPPKDPAHVWVLEAMHRTAQTMRENAVGILNYFRRQLTSGVIESVNGLVQAARSRARGYRNVETLWRPSRPSSICSPADSTIGYPR